MAFDKKKMDDKISALIARKKRRAKTSLSLEAEPFEQLKQLCAEKGVSISELVDKLIEDFLKEYQDGED